MLEPFKNRALLLKIETVEGTDAVPTAGADAFQLMDGTSGITADKIERPVDRPFFGHDPFVVANLRGFIEGSMEIVAPLGPYIAGSKAAIDTALRVSGFAKTYAAGPPALIRYNPISTAFASGTGYFYHAGTLYVITGGKGNISSLQMDIGSYMKAQFRLEGSCTEVQEAALPTGLDYSASRVPVVNSTETMEMRINGVAVEGKGFGIDLGNSMQTIEHTEARLQRIRERKPTFNARFYRPERGTLDPWALWKAGTIIPMWASITEPVTGLMTKLLVRGQIEDVKPDDIDGDLGYQVTGRCIPSSTGGDEVLIEMSDTTP